MGDEGAGGGGGRVEHGEGRGGGEGMGGRGGGVGVRGVGEREDGCNEAQDAQSGVKHVIIQLTPIKIMSRTLPGHCPDMGRTWDRGTL